MGGENQHIKRPFNQNFEKNQQSDNDNESEFQLYLLAKNEELKNYFLEDVIYYWVNSEINQREFQKIRNQLSSEIRIKSFPYLDNMLHAIQQQEGNFKIICEMKDLDRILQYHKKNKNLLCIHLLDKNFNNTSKIARSDKIQIKASDLKDFKQSLKSKNFEKNSIQTFTNANKITNFDISEVNQSRLALKTLLVAKNHKKGKQHFLRLANKVEQDFLNIDQYEKNYKLNSTPEESIKWYTKANFYHRLVNNMLRAGKGNPLYLAYIRFPVNQLYNSIKSLYKSRNLKEKAFECYRGGKINQSQLKYFNQNKKGIIQMQGFLSCSKNKNSINKFIINCVFKISVNNLQRDPQCDHGFCFLDSKDLTQFQMEQEVLFNIFNVMEVKDVTKETFDQKLVDVVHLQYGSLAAALYLKKNKLKEKDFQFSQLCIKNYQALKPHYDSITNQADFFRFFGKFQQIQRYYLAELQFLKKQTTKSKDKQLRAVLKLGFNYLNQKDQTKAKQFLLKAKKIYQQNEIASNTVITLAKIENGLGIANKNLHQFEQAKQNYQKTIQIIKKSNDKNAKNYLATACNNLAAILAEQSKQSSMKQAANYYEKALNLLDGQQNQTIANIYFNLGMYHLKILNFKESIKNFVQSLQIYNKLFGTHKNTINCNIRLGEAYLKNNSTKQYYERHFTTALNMMRSLSYSSYDQYIEVKRQIEQIKQKYKIQNQKRLSNSVNLHSNSIFNLDMEDQVDRYLKKQYQIQKHQSSDYPLNNSENGLIKNQISNPQVRKKQIYSLHKQHQQHKLHKQHIQHKQHKQQSLSNLRMGKNAEFKYLQSKNFELGTKKDTIEYLNPQQTESIDALQAEFNKKKKKNPWPISLGLIPLDDDNFPDHIKSQSSNNLPKNFYKYMQDEKKKKKN